MAIAEPPIKISNPPVKPKIDIPKPFRVALPDETPDKQEPPGPPPAPPKHPK